MTDGIKTADEVLREHTESVLAVTPPINPNYKPIATTKQYVLTVDTGDVVVRWPEALTDEDCETIEGWLDGIKKKIKRSVNPNLKSDGPAKIEMDPR